MRIIDVDAITNKDIVHYLGREYASCTPDVRDLLNDQPTIEAVPVVYGEWIKAENTWVCSVCHKENACAYDETLCRFTDLFCPKCGAKMKGGTE